MMNALFCSWADFYACYKTVQLTGSDENLSTSFLEKQFREHPQRALLSQVLQQECLTLAQVALKLNVNLSVAKKWAKEIGYEVIPRGALIKAEIWGKIERLAAQGLNSQEISIQTGMREQCVAQLTHPVTRRYLKFYKEKHEQNRVKHRQSLIDFLYKNPLAGRQTLRKTKETGYWWLYKHDKAWLDSNLPGKLNNRQISLL